MGIGTKPDCHQHVSGMQFRVQGNDLGHIMGAQGSGEHAEHHASASMKQRQEMGHGEPTSRHLLAGLAKMLLQGGGIGHGKTGTIDPKGAMAQPVSLIKRLGLHRVTDSAEKLLERRQRELHARLTIRRRGDV